MNNMLKDMHDAEIKAEYDTWRMRGEGEMTQQ